MIINYAEDIIQNKTHPNNAHPNNSESISISVNKKCKIIQGNKQTK